MSARELYDSLKNEYVNCLIIVKEKQYYKTFFGDAKIIWYIFHYKYFDDMVTFGNSAFDKVVNKLKSLNINFMIVSKVEQLLSYCDNESSYSSYYQLSQCSYENLQKEKILITKLKVLFKNNPNCYDEICNFFDSFEKNKFNN